MYDIRNIWKADSVEEALNAAWEAPDSILIAGGTDVMIKLKERKLRSAELISIREIPELSGIRMDEKSDIYIGACTTFDEIYRHPIVRTHLPQLAYACNQVGSPQIRHIATIGGNICNGAVSADSVPVLLSLDAQLKLQKRNGTRNIGLLGFHTGPGRTVLEQGELLTEICIRRDDYENSKGVYIKYGKRRAMEIATLGCAVSAVRDAETDVVKRFRIAFGVAGPIPLRCPKLEDSVNGRTIDEKLFTYIEENVLDELSPRESWRATLELREQLIRTLAKRASKEALKQTW